MNKDDVDELMYKVDFFGYRPNVDELDGLFKVVQDDIDELRDQIAAERERQAAIQAAIDSLTAEDMQKNAVKPRQIFAVPKAKDTGKLHIPEQPKPVWNWREGRYVYPTGAPIGAEK